MQSCHLSLFLWPLSHIKYADWTSNGLSSSNHRRSSVHQRLLCLCGLKLARRWFLAIFRQTTQNIDSYLIYFLATNREIIMCVFKPPRHHTALHLWTESAPLHRETKSLLTHLLMNDSVTRLNLCIILKASFLPGHCNDNTPDNGLRAVITHQLISAPGPLMVSARIACLSDLNNSLHNYVASLPELLSSEGRVFLRITSGQWHRDWRI